MKKFSLAVLASSLMLVFCSSFSYAKEENEVRTVSWFRDPANKAALEATLKQCQDNPGQLQNTPNCINARKAAEANFMGGKYEKVREPKFDF